MLWNMERSNMYKFEAEDYFLFTVLLVSTFLALGLIAYGVTLVF